MGNGGFMCQTQRAKQYALKIKKKAALLRPAFSLQDEIDLFRFHLLKCVFFMQNFTAD